MFVRGSDLVISYRDVDESSVRSQVYWRYARADGGVFVVDVIISVETSLLASNPTVSVQSIVGEAEVYELGKQGLRPINFGNDDSKSCESGVLVSRLADTDVSFLTAVHPTDFESMEIRKDTTGHVLSLSLFQHDLEKGVIRRGRVRGAFLPTNEDIEIATRLVEEFANQPPPLTT